MAEQMNQEEVLKKEALTPEQETAEETAEGTAAEKAEPADAEQTAEESAEKAPKKGLKKKWKGDKKADELQEKITAMEDQIKRQLAEFENFRNRTEKEKAAMFEIGAKSVIEKMLPVVDNFERGLGSLGEEEKSTPFAEGMQMVYKQLMTELDGLGVKPIEAVGTEFDPNLHNAVMQVESEEFESGVVAQDLMKGYTYRDSVVRHSMVAVVS